MRQKHILIFLLTCYLLTACVAQPAVPTGTATVTIPPTSTLTPTETPIPTPTDALFSPALTELQQKFRGNYQFSWSNDKTYIELINIKTNEVVPEFQIDPTTSGNPTWSRVYIFEEKEIKIPQELSTIVVDENGNITDLPFPGYVYEEGGWKRKLFEGEPLFNALEAQLMIIVEGDATVNTYCEEDSYRFMAIKVGSYFRLKYNNLDEPVDGWYAPENAIPMKNANGGYDIVKTTPYELHTFTTYTRDVPPVPYSYVFYKTKKGGKIVLMDVHLPRLNSNSNEELINWSDYYLANKRLDTSDLKRVCK